MIFYLKINLNFKQPLNLTSSSTSKEPFDYSKETRSSSLHFYIFQSWYYVILFISFLMFLKLLIVTWNAIWKKTILLPKIQKTAPTFLRNKVLLRIKSSVKHNLLLIDDHIDLGGSHSYYHMATIGLGGLKNFKRLHCVIKNKQ